MTESMRLFVAIRIPGEVKRALADLRSELEADLPSLRWVRSEGIHLTLSFLGEVPVGRIDAVGEALAGCPGVLEPAGLEVAGVGVFPHPRAPRVFWSGFGVVPQSLMELQQGVAVAMAGLGFPRERRDFRPHLTLGRFRRPLRRTEREPLASVLGRDRGRTFGSFSADRLSLFRSTLLPSGASYEELDGWPLTGAGPVSG